MLFLILSFIVSTIFYFLLFLLLLISSIILIIIIILYFLVRREKIKSISLSKKYNNLEEKCGIRLVSLGNEKIKIIKTLRNYIPWDLSTTKQKIESPLPAVIIWNMPLNLAQDLKIELEKLDTVLEIVEKIS